MQEDEPFSENVPAGQFEQVAELAAEYLPAGQSVHKILSAKEKSPAGGILHADGVYFC